MLASENGQTDTVKVLLAARDIHDINMKDPVTKNLLWIGSIVVTNDMMMIVLICC